MTKPSERIKSPIDMGKSDSYMSETSDAGKLLKVKYLQETGFSDAKFAQIVYILDEMAEQIAQLQAQSPSKESK
ncbi:MAG: hypothetical protein Q7K40_03835 [bacterium]|nr:hypothetical protein [bacterium]